ncbi:TylF/MycF/NovP-related O-methyltransferase [Paenibacillus thermotolerans]|uniref:TylF/MycF/NovP-related O-methyltransferase n=1 Tax=Paenibacillus thermotolerans TaxID=3027807 RepID=UPI003CC63064
MFSDTLPEFANHHNEKIAFINIDSDLYSSAKTILTVLNERIVNGTILYFDEITGWGI